MTASIPPVSLPASVSLEWPASTEALSSLSREQFDELEFGVIGLDAQGTIRLYNLAESRLARLDRNSVLGKNFFRTVAPCTATPEFEGRFRTWMADTSAPPSITFAYNFAFKFGAQDVDIALVRSQDPTLFYLLVRRRVLTSELSSISPSLYAPAQQDLAPNESAQGVLRDVFARRSFQLPSTFLQSLMTTWRRVAPRGGPLFAHEWGVQWGRMAMIDIETELLHQTGRSLREIPMSDVGTRLDQWFRSAGWGQLTVDFSSSRSGVFVVMVDRSAIAESVGASEATECHLFSGLFQAMFGQLAARRLHAREVACSSQGYPLCTFVLGASTRKAAIDTAVKESNGSVERAIQHIRESSRAG